MPRFLACVLSGFLQRPWGQRCSLNTGTCCVTRANGSASLCLLVADMLRRLGMWQLW